MATRSVNDAQWVEPEVQQLLNDLEAVREWCPCLKCSNFFGFGCPCCTGCIQSTSTEAPVVYEIVDDAAVTDDERSLLRNGNDKLYFIGLPREIDGSTTWYAFMDAPIAPFDNDARFTRRVYDRSLYQSDRDFEHDRSMTDMALKRREDGHPRRKRWSCSNQTVCTIL